MVVVERYPDLKATQAFRDLQVAARGRRRTASRSSACASTQAAQAFNSARNTFPRNIIAGAFGSRFAEKAYFKAQAGAETAPKVQF